MLSDDCISIVLAFSSRLAKTIQYAKYKRKRKKMEKKVSVFKDIQKRVGEG